MKNSLLQGTLTAGLLTMVLSPIPSSAQDATTGQSPAESRESTGTRATTPTSPDSIAPKERATPQPQDSPSDTATDSSWMAKLDPQMKSVLDEFQTLNPKPFNTLSAEDARKQPSFAEAARKITDRLDKELPEVGRTDDVTIKLSDVELKGRIYQPKGDGPFPVILYVHGGGWVVGSLESYDATPRALCKATNALVISTHYRQAPEHKFPTAHNDVYGAYQWTMQNAGRWNGNGKKIAVVGESAGANMVAAATAMAKHEGAQLPVHQVLIYPVTNTTMDTESYRQYENAKPLDAATMKWFFDQELANPADAKDPKIALLQSESFKGLPPATIITAEIDPLKSEGEALARRFEQDGVQVTYKNFEGVTHEFFGLAHVVDKAQQAVDLVATQLKQSFGRGADQPAAGASAPRTGGTDVGTGIDTGSGTATGGTGAGRPGSERAGTGGSGSGGVATGDARGTGSGTETEAGASGQTSSERAAQDRAASESRTSGTGESTAPDRSGTGTGQSPDRSGETEVEIDR